MRTFARMRAKSATAKPSVATRAKNGKAKRLRAGYRNGTANRFPSTITSPIAASQMVAYLKSNGIGQTEFAVRVGTTDRTLRSFRKTGKVRRGIFDAIAKEMGTSRETLLESE